MTTEKYRAVLERRGAPLSLTYYLNPHAEYEAGLAPRDFPPVDPARTKLDRKSFFEAVLHDSDLPLVTTFLLSGVDVRRVRRAEDGWTALHIAAAGTARRFRLSHTARMPIRPVVPCFNPKVIERLIEEGAEVNARSGDGEGVTPLMIAAALQHTQTMRLLLRHGAQLELRDGAGRTCLSYAAAHPHVLQALCDAVGVSAVRGLAQQTWLLHEVCSQPGSRFAALYCVEQLGLEVNAHAMAVKGSTAMRWAAEEEATIESVVQPHSAPADQVQAAREEQQIKPTTTGRREGIGAAVAIDIAVGGEEDAQDGEGEEGSSVRPSDALPLPFYVQKAYTPLHCAVITGDVELVRSLLEKGARCDLCDTNGRTALALAQDVQGNRGFFFSRRHNHDEDEDNDDAGWLMRKNNNNNNKKRDEPAGGHDAAEGRPAKKGPPQLRVLLSRLSSMVRSRHSEAGGVVVVNGDDTYSYAYETTKTKGATNTGAKIYAAGTTPASLLAEGNNNNIISGAAQDTAARRWVSAMLRDETLSSDNNTNEDTYENTLASVSALPFVNARWAYDVMPYKVQHRKVRTLLERYCRNHHNNNSSSTSTSGNSNTTKGAAEQCARLLQDPAPTLLHRFGVAALAELPVCLVLPHLLFYLACRLTSSMACLLLAQLCILLGVLVVRNREAGRAPQEPPTVRCFGLAVGYWLMLTLVTGRAYEMITFYYYGVDWHVQLISLFSVLGAGLVLRSMFAAPLTVSSSEGQRKGIYALIAQEEAKLSNNNNNDNNKNKGEGGAEGSGGKGTDAVPDALSLSESNGLISATTQPLMGVDLVTMVRKPLRAQRCRRLQRIVLRYDHYSHYLLCPIGAHNHRSYFVAHVCLLMQLCYELIILYLCDGILSSANELLGMIDAAQLIGKGANSYDAQTPSLVPFAFDTPAERFFFVYNYTLLPLLFVLVLIVVAQQLGAITSNMTLFDYEHAEDESSLYCFVLKDKLYSLFDRGPLANLRGFFLFWTENLGVQLYRVPPLSPFLRRKVTQAKKWEKPACGDECEGTEGAAGEGGHKGGCRACAQNEGHGHSHTSTDVTNNLHLQAQAAASSATASTAAAGAQRVTTTNTTNSSSNNSNSNEAAAATITTAQASTQAAVMNLRQHIFNVMVQAGTDELGSFQYVGNNNNSSSSSSNTTSTSNEAGSTIIAGVPAESQQEWLQAVREARQMFHFYTQAKRKAAAASYAHGRGAIAEELREEQGIKEEEEEEEHEEEQKAREEGGTGHEATSHTTAAAHMNINNNTAQAATGEARRPPTAGLRASAKAKDA